MNRLKRIYTAVTLLRNELNVLLKKANLQFTIKENFKRGVKNDDWVSQSSN